MVVMKRVFKRATLAAYLCSLALTASADLIQWTLTDFTFNDGGSASGSFVFDADTNSFSRVNVTTTTGSLKDGATYTHTCTGPCGPKNDMGPFFFLMLGQAPVANMQDIKGLSLVFESPLSNAGGLVNIAYSAESACYDGACLALQPANLRTWQTGSVHGVPFSESPIANTTQVPSLNHWALALLTVILGGICYWRQRRNF